MGVLPHGAKPKASMYSQDGRLLPCYVYLVLCMDREIIFANLGVSDNPTKRLSSLLVGCPYEPGVLATVGVPNRTRAFRIQSSLHAALKPWHLRNTWFRFTSQDKARFNELSRSTLDEYASPSWPLAWTKINAGELVLSREPRAAVAAATA
jgi:hypothetical protein